VEVDRNLQPAFPDLGDERVVPTYAGIPPQNQSAKHYWLCLVARERLLEGQLYMSALECGVRQKLDEDGKAWNRDDRMHRVVDVLAVGTRYHAESRTKEPLWNRGNQELVTVAVEVKITTQDFRSGFVEDAADYNYLATPGGMVGRKELAPGVGLFEYVCDDGHWWLRMSRRAKRIERPRLTVDSAVWRIASCCSSEVRKRTVRIIENPFEPRDGQRPWPFNRMCKGCHRERDLIRNRGFIPAEERDRGS
jgi:hypothetical protein